MNPEIIFSNLRNPTLLFFVLGIVASLIKSDLEIPPQISKFISLYLLFSIGFKGGMELAHSGLTEEVVKTLGLAIGFSLLVPLYTFFLLKRRLNVFNAGALAATYG
ncbi:MAG: sodium-dependent bicarbonate transport family permease, partial [Chitinophagaceae bacterium]